MSGLVLKLAPKERVLINGAVIENGERRTRISIVTPDANILRLKDALHPDDATTPVKRVCYIAQLALSGDAEPEKAANQSLKGIEQLSRVLRDPDSRGILEKAADAIIARNFYPALKQLRLLIPREEQLLRAGQP